MKPKRTICDVVFYPEYTRHGPYKSQHKKGASVLVRWRDVTGHESLRAIQVCRSRGFQFLRDMNNEH